MEDNVEKALLDSKTGFNERNSDYYFEKFDLGKYGEKLIGKKVLDIGAGRSDFANVSNSMYGKGTVIRIDYSYTEDMPKSGDNATAGLAQKLPFSNNQFDEVLMSWSASYWTRNPQEVIKEAMRVTKPGGNLRIRPALLQKDKYLENYFHPTKFTQLKPIQEEEGREFYYTVIITKPNKLEEVNKEINRLLTFLNFSPGYADK